MKFKHIHAQLTTVFLIFFAVSFLLLSGVSYYFSQKYVRAGIESLGKAVASDYAYRLNAHIRDMMTQVLSLAATQRMRSGEREQMVQVMDELHKRAGVFDVLLFAWPDGSAVRWNGDAAEYGDRDYFKRVMQTKKPYVSDVVVSKTNGNMIIALAVPVLEGGEILGVLVGTYNLENLSDFLKVIQFEKTGYGYLMDAQGMVIGNPRQPETIGKLFLGEKAIDPSLGFENAELDGALLNLYARASASEREPVYGDFTFIDGVKQSGVFIPVSLAGSDKPWTLAVMAPREEVSGGLDVMTKAMIGVSAFFIALAFVFIMLVSKGICRPINGLVSVAEKLAAGDLTSDIVIDRSDELGVLQKEIKAMSDELRLLVKNIFDSADELVTSAKTLTASASQSSQAADSVAANVMDVAQATSKQMEVAGETADALEKLSVDAEQAAASACVVRDTSDKTAQSAEKGVKVVEAAVNQMISIQGTVEALAKEISDLGSRSDEIGQIVETISGIAGQTNLLALNAAIEAARAGEQGRGFAVVAEEVRKLAEQSQDAAKQISELISAIQQDTSKAVLAMEAGIKEVRIGSDLVDNAGASFKEIEGFIGQTTTLAQDVLRSAQTISQDTQMVLTGTRELHKLSQDISGETQSVSAATEEQLASTQEIESTCESFRKLAEDLHIVVGQFSL